jgi:hypothetical protein
MARRISVTVAQRGFLLNQLKTINKHGVGSVTLKEDGLPVQAAVEFFTQNGYEVTVQGLQLLMRKKEIVESPKTT